MNKLYYIPVLIVAFAFASCTKAPIHYRDAVTPLGMIHILPDGSEHTLPAMTYYFYPSEGGDTSQSPCDGSGNFSGLLPVGEYKALAVNTSINNVFFSGMNRLSTATAGVGVVTRSIGYELEAPGKLFRVLTPAFTALPDTEVTLNPLPLPLTRQVVIRFTLDEALADLVAGITGILRGVYPQVNLATGQAQAGDIPDISQAGMRFGTAPTATTRSATGYEANLSLFGLANPQHGAAYHNTLTVTLAMKAGGEVEIEVDMNTALTEVINENQGVIPLLLPLEITIEETPIGLTATVVPWRESGDSGKEL